MWQAAASFQQLAQLDSPAAIRQRLIAVAGQCDELAKTIEETLALSMRRSIEKLVDIGMLTHGANKEVKVIYVLEVFSGDQPSIQEIECKVMPVDERGDLAGPMGKELILILRDDSSPRLSLTDAKGNSKGKAPIERIQALAEIESKRCGISLRKADASVENRDATWQPSSPPVPVTLNKRSCECLRRRRGQSS